MNTKLLLEAFKRSTGVSTDSRTVGGGKLFFALHGENFDGNRFAVVALDNGAYRAVVDDHSMNGDDRMITVDDTLAELQSLATCYRRGLKAKVLAITGTNGKTTTKELVTAVLARKFMVHSTKGNLNNHIGVPLTILAAPQGTEIMVVEMGASHPGDIKLLCDIAEPDYGLITNIGLAHLAGFGSQEGVVKTKTELYRYLSKNNGTVIYNDDDALLTNQVSAIPINAVTYSSPSKQDVEVVASTNDLNITATINYNNTSYQLTTHLFGGYNVDNIKAAVAVGLFFGVEMSDIIAAIAEYVPSNNRSQIVNSGKNRLICDSYNANPTSMRKALESFLLLNDSEKVVILGDMLELGDKSLEEHANIVNILKNSDISESFLVGENFRTVVGSDERFKTFRDVTEFTAYLQRNPMTNLSILIKGSRGIGLERIYELL